jgi:hypothetical protein
MSSSDDESSIDDGYTNCGCKGCVSGEMMYDTRSRFHVTFCLNCDRCYCFGSGLNRLSCQCCQPCYLKQCKKVDDDTPTNDDVDEDDSDEYVDAVEQGSNNDEGNSSKNVKLTAKSKIDTSNAISLAKQSEVTVVRASSSGPGLTLDTLLTERKGTKTWLSKYMKTRERQEQFVEFQLSPDRLFVVLVRYK